MKLLSFAIPCYNSQDYMEKCVNSILKGGEDVEILIVDDGSKDDTAQIADRLEKEHPTIIKAIHQENGGHGDAVCTGIKNATGLYFKVVDSDDWVNEEALLKILDTLRQLLDSEKRLDMLISNYVYEKVGEKHKKVIQYRHVLPSNEMFTWKDIGNFKKGQYILMHSVIFRTSLLKECNLELPKHTFYVDNLYVYKPLPLVKNMYYLDVNFYRYFIGRDDQSVNESIMIKRVDQQILVNKLMFEFYSGISKGGNINYKLKRYMYSYLEIITTISSILLILDDTKDSLEKKKDLWNWMLETDERLEKKIRRGLLGTAMNLPGELGRRISVGGYHVAQKLFHFN